jgi:hypothetical protein
MTPEELQGLLPSQEVLRGWQTVADARAWAGLSEAVLGEFLALLGNRELSNLPLQAAIDPVMVRRTIGDVRVPVDPTVPLEGEEAPAPRRLTTIEKTQLCLFYNAVRVKFGLPPVDVVSEPEQTPTGVNQTPMDKAEVAPTLPLNPLHKIRLSSVLDQVSDAEVQMLPPEVIAEKRNNYRMITGGDPLEQCNFTDAQLSALSQRVAGGQPPYADFAVWGPYGSRIEKRMKFRSSFLDTSGNWKSIEVPGPSSFQVWEECWEVFAAACIADGIATQATLAMYAAEFKSRVRDFGSGCWQICVEADVIARSEQFVLEHARQFAIFRANPSASNFDPSRRRRRRSPLRSAPHPPPSLTLRPRRLRAARGATRKTSAVRTAATIGVGTASSCASSGGARTGPAVSPALMLACTRASGAASPTGVSGVPSTRTGSPRKALVSD